MTLEWTGERFVPGAGGAAIAYEHRHRYLVAERMAAGRQVLDLASGEGYGSNLLAQRAALVVGLEIDVEAVAHADAKYQRDNLRFVRGDIRRAPLVAGVFDVLTCFEVIEHVTRPELVLQEARRLLRPDGVLVISTPERKEYSDARHFKNEFHEHEFYEDEFRAFLQSAFPCVEVFGQRLLTTSALWPLDPPIPKDLPAAFLTGTVATADPAEGLPRPQYCIAACGGEEAHVRERVDQSLSLLVDPLQEWIDEYDQGIEARANLELEVVDLKAHTDLLLSIKAHHEEQIAQLTSEVETLRIRLRELYKSTSWRLTQPLRATSRLLASLRRQGF